MSDIFIPSSTTKLAVDKVTKYYICPSISMSSLHLLLRLCDTTPPIPIKRQSLKSAIHIIV